MSFKTYNIFGWSELFFNVSRRRPLLKSPSTLEPNTNVGERIEENNL